MRGPWSWNGGGEDDAAYESTVRLLTDIPEAEADEQRLRLSDLGGLARRYRRRIIRAARAADRPTFASLISEHLEVPLAGTEVVEESWPSYDLVNVQLGINAWL